MSAVVHIFRFNHKQDSENTSRHTWTVQTSLLEKFDAFVPPQAFQGTVHLICFNLNLRQHLSTITTILLVHSLHICAGGLWVLWFSHHQKQTGQVSPQWGCRMLQPLCTDLYLAYKCSCTTVSCCCGSSCYCSSSRLQPSCTYNSFFLSTFTHIYSPFCSLRSCLQMSCTSPVNTLATASTTTNAAKSNQGSISSHPQSD